ncbi:MAG: hypothetical protein ACRCX2_29760 [Paraclostridium sp.]
MSGKYMATDLKVERSYWNEDVFISYYLDMETYKETRNVFAVLVNKKYSMDEAIELASKKLKQEGHKKGICTCYKGRLGYNEEEGYYEKECCGESVSEVMWIINLN